MYLNNKSIIIELFGELGMDYKQVKDSLEDMKPSCGLQKPMIILSI